ncbi:hypothetical protein PILCRDRAFT_716206 [Piloderma croceum F 1598]|uniref:Uncharacterized protein n=1 Tax=Piloderma croceum (strain F 1598) TaxID=765440 RepID=A0A0C3EMV4_PILCF|nr:hypothetical protein PILCRDRAFT_716206 [Piloderma croceum F 1598]
MTKSTGTTGNGGITLGWQGTGMNAGFSRRLDDTISTDAYDMTAKGARDPREKHGIRWELQEGEKCKLDNYTCEIRFEMRSEVNAHFRLVSRFTRTGIKLQKEIKYRIPDHKEDFMKLKFHILSRDGILKLTSYELKYIPFCLILVLVFFYYCSRACT